MGSESKEKKFLLQPEVAGQLGEGTVIDVSVHPPVVTRLHFVFDGWLGDDLVESFPCFLVTDRLKRAIETMPLNGAKCEHAILERSELFEELHSEKRLPDFWWLRVSSNTDDDFSLSKEGSLVVTERALKVLNSVQIENCEIRGFN